MWIIQIERMKLRKSGARHIVLIFLILLPYLTVFYVYQWYNKKANEIENAHFVIISKQDMVLSLYNFKGQELFRFPVACGLNYGDKTEQGDMKTPEGIFRVSEIQKSDNWSHDFKDGNGPITGAFGPCFIRLYIPEHSGIGIHGTHDNNSLGKRVTEGCIRMRNEDLLNIVPFIRHGTVVIITASKDDLLYDSRDM